ncbi:MAG: serine hydrolase [Candidatus Aminicenantes bacterium]|nr:serine hydrolase [Candidatus Aminicenantes bacterium]
MRLMRFLRRFALGLLAFLAAVAAVVFLSPYLRRIALLGNADVYDVDKLPSRTIERSRFPLPLPARVGVDWIAPLGLVYKNEPIRSEDELARFLEARATTAFIVVSGGEIVLERYLNGSSRESYFKSFSISKSVISALIGAAVGDGLIGGPDDLVTEYIPEMKDPNFGKVTLGHCLDNTAGIHYTRGVMPWTTRPRMYYTTDLRRYLAGVRIDREPGRTFMTDDLSPQILGFVLERAIRKADPGRTVSSYFQEKIWEPLGAEFDSRWNLDHAGDGLEKGESGFAPRAIDLVKFGLLYLREGSWSGRQIVPRSWILETTVPGPPGSSPSIEKTGFYKRLWWGQAPFGDTRPDYYANGHFGQRLYVSPSRDLVLLRLGYADGGVGWTGFLSSIAERCGKTAEGEAKNDQFERRRQAHVVK